MNPFALPAVWAGVAAAVAVAAVVLLYLLKPPPRRLLVPSSLIWERVLRQAHRRADRLRWWLSLLLAAAIVSLMMVALTRPQLTGAGDGTAKLVLVIDNSPTMATRTPDGLTRWDHAVSAARTLLESRSAGTQVWLADTMRRIPTPGYEDRDAAVARLSGLRVAYGGVPRLPVLDPAAEAVVVSDGVRIGPVPPTAEIESVFEPVENVGITAFELRPLPVDPRSYQAFVEIHNAGGADKRVEIVLAGTGGRRVSKTLDVAAGRSRADLIDVSSLEAGPVRAALAVAGDGLAADDEAYAWLPTRRVMRVTLVTAGNSYLEKSLRAQPRVQLKVTSPGNFTDSRDVDAWVFDRFAPAQRPAAPALLFRPGKADWLPEPGAEVADIRVAAWVRAHPLLDNLSLRDLHVDRARPARAPGINDIALVSISGGVPIVIAHEGAVRRVAFAFALEDSNFALHAGFPIFLDNALNWMLSEPASHATGLGQVEVPVAGARIVAGDGTEVPARSIPGGSLFEVSGPGLYTAITANQRVRISANLLDVSATDVNRSQWPVREAAGTQEAGDAYPYALEPWFVLLLLAALLLCFEWWSWNRRVTL